MRRKFILPGMNLIIDTSTERGMIVFAKGEKVLCTFPLPFGFQSSQLLFPNIQKGFEELGLDPGHLKGIAVCVGPGLFSGMRVGVAAAKGLAYARKLPLVGLGSLSAFISPHQGRFYSVIDGRSRGVYLLLQERIGNEVVEIGELELISYEEMNKKELLCVGPSFARIGVSSYLEIHPDPHKLARLASQKLQKYALHSSSELELSYH